MNAEEAAKKFGYTELERPHLGYGVRVWTRRVEATPCETNGNKISIEIHEYALLAPLVTQHEVSMVGEAGDAWFILKAYALTARDLERLPELEAQLVRAWEALER